MKIEQIVENKKKHMGLLLLADPDEEMIYKYLGQGDVFVLSEYGQTICQAVVVEISDSVCELKNIATAEEFQKRGYASEMIRFLFGYYKKKYKTMIVGTAENGAGFYIKNGFSYSHTVKNFFTDNYPEPVIDNGSQCIDMIYYKKDL